MTEIQVGKVMLTPKGEYDSTKTYTRLDAVTYQGSSYVCLADTSSTPPSESWQLLADKGADGQPGKDGQPGSPGVTPHIDATTGNWFIGTTNTGVKAQGPAGQNGSDGKPGSNGSDGKPGADGVTPHIDSTTGHWFVGSTDTGVSARGPQGEQGSPGKDGVTPDVSKLVAKTDLANYYTKPETDSAINSSIGKIQIGGRNLILNSSTEKSGKSYDFAQYNFAEDLQPGETYTLSAYGRVDQTAIDHKQFIEIYVYAPDWSYDDFLKLPASLTNNYGQLTFTVPADKHPVKYVTVFLMHPDGATDESKDNLSGTAFVNYLKLEKGNKATDWTPAPEDTITAIQKNTTAIGQAKQQITDLQTAVSNTVTTITSGTLADLASKTGVYHYEIDFIPSDSPTHDGGLLDVVVGANYAKQVFTNTANSDVYVRTRKQGVWSAWRQVTLWN